MLSDENDYDIIMRRDAGYDQINILVESSPWWYELYKRIKLFPWWALYNIGYTKEASLKDKILKLATKMEFHTETTSKIIRHAISEFSKQGLGSDYYGYHNINHPLGVAYVSLLSAGNQKPENKISKVDIKNLFVAALFHDFDPKKQFDKPNEDNVELFIRNDQKLAKLIDSFEIDLNIVLALVHRTTYPFTGAQKEHALKRMQELFSLAGIHKDDTITRQHYEELGWFLSICDRIAGYCLGDFEYAMELARRNAHAIGWHPSVINEESVKYFCALKKEKDIFERAIQPLPMVFKKNFFDNVAGFREAWENELKTKVSLRKNEISLVTVVENSANNNNNQNNNNIIDSVMRIRQESHSPMNVNDRKFRKSLYDPSTILITLRINNDAGDAVGYVKGGPLEKYKLRRGTHDGNLGNRNTVFMEWIVIKTEYWGETGGHMLRSEFLKEAVIRGYNYATSYVHREVIINRKNKGEPIEIIQKYDPDRLDYYRIDLSQLVQSIPIQ